MKTLGELLQEINLHPWQSALFVETDVQLAPTNRAQIVRTDDFTQEPLEPVAPMLSQLLSVQETQDIVSNARQQLAKPTTEQLVEALQYYVLKDAFIEFAKPKRGGETAAARRSRS